MPILSPGVVVTRTDCAERCVHKSLPILLLIFAECKAVVSAPNIVYGIKDVGPSLMS